MAGQSQRFLFAFVLLVAVSSVPVSASWEDYEGIWTVFAEQPDAEELWKEHMLQFQRADQPLPFTFDCNTSSSGEPATSVHRLRPGDISVVGALGDSLTAANGADAKGVVRVLREYRGVSWSVGGQGDLASGVSTMPNILRNYNPNLRGMSTRTGTVDSRFAGFNVAVPGAKAYKMPMQARDLVEKMKASSNVDMDHDWKMVTLFIGGNDLCGYCGQEEKYSAYQYSLHIRDALDILQDQLPRTFVNLVAMFDIAPVASLGDGLICKTLHVALCNCGRQEKNAEMLKKVVGDYNKALEDLLATGRYETRDDFTVVLQPFMQYTDVPKLADGSPDLSYFAPDCFHFSQRGHGEAAVMLWNGMFQPVGQKSRDIGFGAPLQCPSVGAFIPTARNSAGK